MNIRPVYLYLLSALFFLMAINFQDHRGFRYLLYGFGTGFLLWAIAKVYQRDKGSGKK